jgi:hypothetical protein
MNNHQQQSEMFYDQASRSPNSNRAQQSLHRQGSRHFDAYGQLPTPQFNQDEQESRYNTGRFGRMSPTIQTGGNNGGNYGSGYGYELGGSQTWNPNAFSNNHGFGAFSATTRMKPSTRGRSTLPPVCILYRAPCK